MMIARNLRLAFFKVKSYRTLSSLPHHTVVDMPSLSPTMTVGTVAKWLCKVGDKISPGDSLADIETDKASMSFDAQDEFYIAKILVDTGVEVSVGTPILISVDDESLVPTFESYQSTSAKAVEQPKIEVPAKVEIPTVIPTKPLVKEAEISQKKTTPPPSPTPVVSVTPAFVPPSSVIEKKIPQSIENYVGIISVNWGNAVVNSPLSKKLATQQSNYIKKYGRSCHKPSS